MNRFAVRCSLLAIPLLLAANTWAQQPPATHVTDASSKESVPPAPVAPIATLGQRQLFGTLLVATKSDDARKLLEKSIDQYENYLLEMSVSTAHEAAAKDPHFALAFAQIKPKTFCDQSPTRPTATSPLPTLSSTPRPWRSRPRPTSNFSSTGWLTLRKATISPPLEP